MLKLFPVQAQTYLAAGDRITDVTVAADLDEIFSQVSVIAKDFGETINGFKGIIGEQEKVNLKKSLENIQVVSGDFKELVASNKDNIGRIVNNLEAISKDIENGKGTIGKLVKDETLYNDAKDVVASLKTVSKDIEQGKGTFGKLAKDEALYTDVRKAVDNITEITDGIKKGEGTFGKLAKDESLYNETEKAMKKVQKAAEGIQELTPITILGTIFGSFFLMRNRKLFSFPYLHSLFVVFLNVLTRIFWYLRMGRGTLPSSGRFSASAVFDMRLYVNYYFFCFCSSPLLSGLFGLSHGNWTAKRDF